MSTEWFLSFDPATKTFAFVLVEINMDLFRESDFTKKVANLKNITDISAKIAEIKEINAQLKTMITIHDGETVDLAPGIKNDELSPIERVKAITKYVKARILPILTVAPTILVEFQMGPNVKSSIISHVLFTIFAEYKIIEVYPFLKNKVHFSPKSHYSVFSKKYANQYTANKNHTIACLRDANEIFTCKIKDTSSHVADSFAQIIGYLVNLHQLASL